jgi:hypothetical protein
MRKASIVAAVALAAVLQSAPAFAWGTAAHRFIMTRAIDLLPPELKPFFTHYRDQIVTRSIDPDTWRLIGWEEDPNHFLDYGAREFGAYPFNDLPREYGAALEKFGRATLDRLGTLPWRYAEEFGNLRRAFEDFKRDSPYAPSNVVLFAPVAAHYIQDAHQPLHASNNHDGQLTGNTGIHARFERDLFERFESRLHINPAPGAPARNARDEAFAVLLESYRLVDPILTADSEAIAGKDVYDDEYYAKFFAAVQPTLEKRIADSITATAAMIVGAWEAAGKPTLSIEGARPLQKVRKP